MKAWKKFCSPADGYKQGLINGHLATPKNSQPLSTASDDETFSWPDLQKAGLFSNIFFINFELREHKVTSEATLKIKSYQLGPILNNFGGLESKNLPFHFLNVHHNFRSSFPQNFYI